MNEKKLFESFQKLFTEHSLAKLKDKVIYKEGIKYRLFEEYEIVQTVTGFEVSKLCTDITYVFSTLQYAVTWVVLDKRNKILLQNRVRDLDFQLSGLEVIIKSGENARKKSKLDFVRYNKVIEAKLKKQLISEELSGYVQQTKQWQLNNFNQQSL